MKLYPDHPQELFRSARDWSLLANRVARGKPELTLAEQKHRDKYAQLALDTLRRAVERGFHDKAKLEKDAAFELLRPREDFQKLLAGIKPKDAPEK